MGYRWNSNTELRSIYKSVVAILDRSDDRLLFGERIVVSPLEYDVLCDRLIEAFGMPTLEEDSICVLAMWVNSFRLGRDEVFLEKISSLYKKIPSYGQGSFFMIYVNKLYDFNIDTFGLELKTIEDIHELLRKHAMK